MIFYIIVFTVLIAFVVAKLEIEIEGKNGWAENLPTWRIKNRITKLFWGEQPYTGYHFWFLMMIIVMSHFPIVLGLDWSWSKELVVWAIFLIASVLEDFFWFILNPHYGIKKFNPIHAPWHDKWIWKFPLLYVRLLGTSAILLTGSYFLSA